MCPLSKNKPQWTQTACRFQRLSLLIFDSSGKNVQAGKYYKIATLMGLEAASCYLWSVMCRREFATPRSEKPSNQCVWKKKNSRSCDGEKWKNKCEIK